MLNQYYEFLTKSLVRWLDRRTNLKAGNKYFVLLDNEEDTKKFYQTFEKINFKGKFYFQSEEYNYKTIGFNKNGIKVLFVAPTDNVTQDFLVTIRNRVNANQDEWKNTAVFFMVHNALDSIIGGAYDVSQRDAPFHAENIKNEVIKEIDESKISIGYKATLETYLDEITSQSMTVLKDYETLFSILESEDITPDDFNTMGYFPDSNIETYDIKTIKRRLGDNKELFEKVETIQQFSDVKERLYEEFQGDGTVNALSKEEDWKNVEFSRVIKAKEEFEKDNVRDIEMDVESIIEDDKSFWFRQHGDSKAQRRKAHVLISSSVLNSDTIEFDISFDDKVRRSDIDKTRSYLYSEPGVQHNDMEITAKNKSVHIRIRNIKADKTYGGQIQYKHYGKNNLKFVITLMIVPIVLDEIKYIRPNFQVKLIGNMRDRRYYYGLGNQGNNYLFGNGEHDLVIESKSQLDGKDIANSRITISENFSGNTVDDVRFDTVINEAYFPIELLDLDYKSIPSQAIKIERQRLAEKNNQFIYRDHKIYVGSKNISVEKSYQEYLDLEAFIIEQKSLSGYMKGTEYQNHELNIPASIQQAYDELLAYYAKEETTLSLAVNNGEHIRLLKQIIHVIIDEMDRHLVHNKPLSHAVRDVGLIGIVRDYNVIRVNPLNPMEIAYQLELYEQLESALEIPREAILATLNPENLMPYVSVDNQHYQSTYTRSYPRWLFYNKIAERQLSDLSSNIIKKRLDDYLNQYKFLFSTNPNMILNVAAIDIVDEENFFDAIINFMVDRLSYVKDIVLINPINLYVNKVGTSLNSLFHQLYILDSIEDLNNLLKNAIAKKSYSDYEDYEVIEMLQHCINIYRLPDKDTQQFEKLFFHITFYQFAQKDNINKANMHNISKNYTLSGLLNNNQFNLIDEQYLNGFGLGKSTRGLSQLINFAAGWNSFIASSNRNTDIYQKEIALVNYIPQINQAELSSMFESSGWVTLLNLDVDLSYFYDESNLDLLVIHYSDQNASNQYESVTVTNDIRQYDYLLKMYIENYGENDKIDTQEIIKNFNAINGQWLLRLISDKQKQQGNQHLFREKLSIISAYKELLGILNHPNIYWVPIALEEVLRVSGMVGLSPSEGLFSAKNLGHTGNTSDDLLMMGVEESSDGLLLHFLPVEVKIGINDSSVRQKAISQVENTYDLLYRFLSDENQDGFMQRYYLNFFVSLMTSNLDKMISSGIYAVDSIDNYEEIKDKLRIGQFKLSEEMRDYFGKGIIFEFTQDQIARTSQRLSEKNISLIKVPESDAYNVISYNTREVIERISQGQFDFDSNILLSNLKESVERIESKHVSAQVQEIKVETEDQTLTYAEQSTSHEGVAGGDNPYIIDGVVSESKVNFGTPAIDSEYSKENYESPADILEKVIEDDLGGQVEKDTNLSFDDNEFCEKRLLIGKVLNSNYDVYWEYGHKGLSNRHMLITGKSGQGKTYFIQTLLHEFSKELLNVLVVDYTDGFLTNQLEPELIENLGNKINQKIIYQDLMPLNPFKIQQIDLGGISIEEKPIDMVERVVQIIDFVFNLGIQQRTLLTETILEGYKLNGASYTFSHLREDLINSEDSSKQNLYGRVSTLLKRDPFAYDNNFTWKNIFNNTGEIHIFQLKGFQRQIQQVMIEFMLWDLFQYATKSGTEKTPLPIVLDEIQNLNFNSSSPTVKILREGRKFGLSGIFATQSLDSMKGTDSEAIYNAAQHVHFLPPESQIRSIAKSMASTSIDSKEVESQLKSLHKGEAIIYGPTLRETGNLTPPQKNIARVTSFENRINR